MIKHFTTQENNITASFLSESIKDNIAGCELSVPNDVFATSIEALYYGLIPRIFAMEIADDKNCRIDILNSKSFISAVIDFMANDRRYPIDGLLTDFQGKMFTEIERKEQRKFRETPIGIIMLPLFSGNRGKEEAYMKMVAKIDQLP